LAGILVIRLKGLGDIVHLLPSLALMRRRHPDLPLGFLCQAPFQHLIPPALGLDLWALPAHAPFFETLRVVRQLRRRKYDRLYDLFGNPRTALVSLLSGIPFRAGFPYRGRRWAYHAHYAPPDSNVHLTRLFGDFFAHFGISGELTQPAVHLPPGAIDRAEEFLRREMKAGPRLAINPHATYPAKAWPMAYFAEIARRWHRETGHRVLVCSGPGEAAATRELLANLGSAVAFTHPTVDIPGFCAFLSQLDLLITADTGPMNLAWAVGTPVAALFGPTTRRAVAPPEENNLILYHPTLACLQCHKEICADGRCMIEMTPDRVFEEIRKKFPPLFSPHYKSRPLPFISMGSSQRVL
jgi:ADP-heptose:LPS heptosyltransferase